MTATIAGRVAAGSAWLDEHEPGWIDRIDIDTLNLSSLCGCVLGQLETDYSDLTPDEAKDGAPYFDALRRHDVNHHWAEAHGFTIDAPFLSGEWDELTAAWCESIRHRRERAS